MQVILLENISKLGKIGDLVKVKNGYARNFLLKKNKALRANKVNIALVNKNKSELTKKNTEIKNKFILVKCNKLDNKYNFRSDYLKKDLKIIPISSIVFIKD